jgi:hypothetical protein
MIRPVSADPLSNSISNCAQKRADDAARRPRRAIFE